MYRYGLFIGIALVGLLLQSTVFSQLSGGALKPDLAFLVAVYLGLHKPMGEAIPAVVVIGYLADRFSVLPDGTFLLVYLCAFYLAVGSAKVFYFRGTGFPALMAFLLSGLYVLALDRMAGYGVPGGDPSRHSLGFLLLFAAASLLFSLPLYRVCRLVDAGQDLRAGTRPSL